MKRNITKLINIQISITVLVLVLSFSQYTSAQMNLQFADTLEQTLVDFANANNMEGVASAVVFPDGSTWSSTHGYHDNVPLDTDMLYDIGSNTKSMVSALILMLEEDGLLSINDTIYSYINIIDKVPFGITIKHLLEQRSGIANFTDHPDYFDSVLINNQNTFWHPDSSISYYLEDPLFSADQFWHYSNTNYLLLGKIIEEVEGQPLNTVLYNRLFAPFNLNHSYLETYDIYSEIKTGAYMWQGNYWLPSTFYALMSSAWAAGAVVTTPDNFASYCHQLFRGDILSQNAFNKMKLGTNFGGGNIYGKGIEKIIYNGRPYYMHGGNTMQNSEMHYSIESDFSVTVMDIDMGFYDETRDLQKALIDVLEFAVHNVLSIDDKDEILAINSYPNPSNQEIVIELPNDMVGKKISFEIYNSIGQVVCNDYFDTNKIIVNKLTVGEGVFIVKFYNEEIVLGNERIIFY